MKKILAIALGIIFLAACSTSNEVTSNRLFQKRKYKKGWHINSSKSFDKSSKGKKNEEIAAVKEKVAKTTTVSSEKVEKEVIPSTNQDVVSSEIETTTVSSANSVDLVEYTTVTKKNNSSVEEDQNIAEGISNTFEEIAVSENELSSEDSIQGTDKEEKNDKSSDDDMLILLYILAVLIPFVAVGIVTDWDIKKVLINLLLSFLCYIPGVIHAFITIRDYK
ncbi:MAG: YqaE/Pmp3 family membrane protein [Flavobacteriales bacterium]